MDNISISLWITLGAGFLSFLSPCVLPLVPAYIGYIVGNIKNESNKKLYLIILKSLLFTLGFSVVFIIMGATASYLGQLFLEYKHIIKKISGIIIIIFGIHLTGIFKLKFFYFEKKFLEFKSFNTFGGPFLLGLTFATGWTPCIGPILTSVLVLAANSSSLSEGVLLLLFYSLGLSIPFIITSILLTIFSTSLKFFNKYLVIFSVISGILLILTGVLIFFDKFFYLSQYFNFFNLG